MNLYPSRNVDLKLIFCISVRASEKWQSIALVFNFIIVHLYTCSRKMKWFGLNANQKSVNLLLFMQLQECVNFGFEKILINWERWRRTDKMTFGLYKQRAIIHSFFHQSVWNLPHLINILYKQLLLCAKFEEKTSNALRDRTPTS